MSLFQQPVVQVSQSFPSVCGGGSGASFTGAAFPNPWPAASQVNSERVPIKSSLSSGSCVVDSEDLDNLH